ncbi:MAG: Lrp/AsnC family transcriptional regulator [Nanoarchaeota archaeon]
MRVLTQETFPNKLKLDAKDKQILAYLALDVRIPYTTLAKKVLLSPDAVRYRIDRLKQEQVLIGTRTLVSLGALGFSSYHLFLSLHPPNLKKEADYIRFFETDSRVNAALQYMGKWDFELAVVSKTPKDLDSFRVDLSQRCPTIQEERIILLLETLKSTALPERIFPDLRMNPASEKIKKKIKMSKLDEKDHHILSVLAEEADMKVEKIVEKTKLSRDIVSYRMKRLVESGVIVGFRPIINYTRLGFSIYAVLFKLQVRSVERERSLRTFLQESPAVLWAVRTLGEWDLLIYIIGKDTEDFYRTIVEIREGFADMIKNYEALIAYREYKYTYLPEIITQR